MLPLIHSLLHKIHKTQANWNSRSLLELLTLGFITVSHPSQQPDPA